MNAFAFVVSLLVQVTVGQAFFYSFKDFSDLARRFAIAENPHDAELLWGTVRCISNCFIWIQVFKQRDLLGRLTDSQISSFSVSALRNELAVQIAIAKVL